MEREFRDSPADTFWRGNPAAAFIDLRIFVDVSDIGGEGGVAVEDANDGLVGGVPKIGEFCEFLGDRSNVSGV